MFDKEFYTKQFNDLVNRFYTDSEPCSLVFTVNEARYTFSIDDNRFHDIMLTRAGVTIFSKNLSGDYIQTNCFHATDVNLVRILFNLFSV